MKKLLTFLIMLAVSMAVFAMPFVGETDAAIAMNTVEAVPHFEGVFAAVTDVSPVIIQAENSLGNINYFEKSVSNVNGNVNEIAHSQYRQEVISLSGYSKTTGQKVFDNLRLTPEGWY